MTTTDLRHTRGMPEEGFQEIQLSGKQLVFLFMATTVVSVVIFLCGVLVGRGVRTEAAEASRSTLATPVDAIPAGANAPLQASAEGGSEAAEPQTASPPVEAAKATAGSYYPQLMGETPPPETVKAREPAAAPAAEPPPPQAAAEANPPSADGGWIVQVAALRQRPEAQAVAARLVNRGYKAFVLDPQPDSTKLYRVRVGPFAERADAEQTVKRLSSEEHFNPWISR